MRRLRHGLASPLSGDGSAAAQRVHTDTAVADAEHRRSGYPADSTIDAAIVGGGPAGAVAAAELRRRGRTVVLCDPETAAERRIGESLPGIARRLLRHLEMAELLEDHLLAAGNCSSWGSPELQYTDFIRDPHGPGLHLDRARFDQSLRDIAAARGSVLLRARVRDFRRADGHWQICAGEDALRANWLVDATGRSASIARKLGAERSRDDGLVSLFAWARCAEADVDSRTLVEACREGWWYTSRLPGRDRVVALHVDSDRAGQIHRSGSWWRLLAETHHVHQMLRGAAFLDPIRGMEAGGGRLDQPVGDHWLAVGDAAMSFDPLSSQGIYNAMYCGMKAAECIDHALSGEADATDTYRSQLERIRAAYLVHHQLSYAVEPRWPASEFWSRRRASRLARPAADAGNWDGRSGQSLGT